MDPLLVGQDRREAFGDAGVDPLPGLAAHLDLPITRVDQRSQRDRLALHGHDAGLQPGQVEQLLDQASSRSDCWSMTASVAGLGSSTPSRRFSRCARSAEIGVFSSCDTLATRSRRSRSTLSNSAAIRLNVSASPARARRVR